MARSPSFSDRFLAVTAAYSRIELLIKYRRRSPLLMRAVLFRNQVVHSLHLIEIKDAVRAVSMFQDTENGFCPCGLGYGPFTCRCYESSCPCGSGLAMGDCHYNPAFASSEHLDTDLCECGSGCFFGHCLCACPCASGAAYNDCGNCQNQLRAASGGGGRY